MGQKWFLVRRHNFGGHGNKKFGIGADRILDTDQERLADKIFDMDQERLADQIFDTDQERLADQIFDMDQERLTDQIFDMEQERLADQIFDTMPSNMVLQKLSPERVWSPTGFNMNPQGHNRPWRTNEARFHEKHNFNLIRNTCVDSDTNLTSFETLTCTLTSF